MTDNYKRVVIILMLLSLTACGEKKNEQQGFPVDDPISEAPIGDPIRKQDSVAFPGFITDGKDTVKLPNGLAYIPIKEGKGAKAKKGKKVSVHYTGYLTDGTVFDSSIDNGKPYKFELGSGIVIQGWDEGIAELNAGAKARLLIPHDLGYGKIGRSPLIPPDADLIFDVELVSVE